MAAKKKAKAGKKRPAKKTVKHQANRTVVKTVTAPQEHNAPVSEMTTDASTVIINNNIGSGFASPKKPVNWVVTLIFSVILGWLGIDRFIMGHVGLGILKLITGGGIGIWWLIDIILIATKHEFKTVQWV